MGIAEDQKVDAVEEQGEQDAPDGEVGDKGDFFSVHLFGISYPLSTFASLSTIIWLSPIILMTFVLSTFGYCVTSG
jgi:hypothetical protein